MHLPASLPASLKSILEHTSHLFSRLTIAKKAPYLKALQASSAEDMAHYVTRRVVYVEQVNRHEISSQTTPHDSDPTLLDCPGGYPAMSGDVDSENPPGFQV